MKLKRFISGALIACMCLIMAACSQSKEANDVNNGKTGVVSAESSKTGVVNEQSTKTEKKVFDAPYEISILNRDVASWPYKEDWYVKKAIEESTNAVLKVIPVESAKFVEKVNMLMASGDLPDLIVQIDQRQVRQYVNQGAYVNISENLSKMPNLKKWTDGNQEAVQKLYAADGKLYSVPNYGIGIGNTRFWFYRKDIFDKYELKAPKTDEELYTVLKKLKEKDPNSFPLNFREFGMLSPSWNTRETFYYDFDKKEWRYWPIEDSYKEMVIFLRTLYAEKLIPQDIYSQNAKAWTDTMVQGKSYITFDYVGRVQGLLTSGKKLNNNYNLNYMPPLNGKFDFTATEYSSVTISKNAKNTDNLLKFMDWFFSEEAKEKLGWGEEGVTYKVENGIKKFIDANYRAAYGIGNIGWFGVLNKEPILSTYPEVCVRALNEQPKYELKENPQAYVGLNEKESETNSIVGTAINKFKLDNISQFITGQKSMDEWDDYVASIKAIGIDKMIEVYAGAYKRLGN